MDEDELMAHDMLMAWIGDDKRALTMQQGRPESPGHLVAPPHLKNFRNDAFVLNNSQSAQEAERIMEMMMQGPNTNPYLKVGKAPNKPIGSHELLKVFQGVLR